MSYYTTNNFSSFWNDYRDTSSVDELLGIEEKKILLDSKFIDDLGADSLDTVELVMAFEEQFGIEIPDDAAETISTVQNAIDFINSKQ